MGSQSSKFGQESMSMSRNNNNVNFISTNQNISENSNISMASNQSGGVGGSRTHKTNNRHKEDDVVNTYFRWNCGGNTVMLTGTFTGWKDHIPLQKVGQEFSTILKLVRGVYQYKYIVDGDWRFSPDDATTHDEQGNINNVIDTTTIEPAIQEISRQDSGVIPEKKYQKVEINTQTQFHDNAPQVPAHLLQITFLNEKDIRVKQMNSKTTKLADNGEMDIEADEKTLKHQDYIRIARNIENLNSLMNPSHVVLNHLGVSRNNYTEESKNYTVNTMTQRFKSKYATIKFYTSRFAQVKG